MQTVVHTKAFEAAARACGLTEQEITALELMLASDPMLGDPIQGSGGCRKVRLAGRGKGKSGGYRVITFYASALIPVVLLYVYSKGERDNLTDAQVKALKTAAKDIVEGYKKRPIRTIR